MPPAIIAHALVPARAERVEELARLYGRLEDAVAAAGADSDPARDAHRALGARIAEWEAADLADERRDVVQLAANERETMLRDVDRAIAHAERYGEETPPTEDEQAALDELRSIRRQFPSSLPRAALVRFRRSAARGKRLEALGGPAFTLRTEAGVLLGALESATAPIAPGDVQFDPENGFRGTFAYGLEACALRTAGAAGAVDLGLGASPAVPALLGVTAEDLEGIYDRWLDDEDGSHMFAPYPYVPRGRFRGTNPTELVSSYLSSTGPIGWAAGDDVAIVARDLRAVAADQPDFGAALRACADRVESAAHRGHAVIGLIEYVPPENEGWRKWLVDNDDDERA